MRPPTQIINQQRRLVEIGRIRIGEYDGRPKSRETFRLTSRDRGALEQAAILWGGEVVPWVAKPKQKNVPPGQFELATEVSELPIIVSGLPALQSYEFYTAGGCQRRCNGAVCEVAEDGGFVEQACRCYDKDGLPTEFGFSDDGCEIVTRVKVMLPDLPRLGVWMLVTRGYYASQEIPTTLAYLPPMTETLLAIETRTQVVNNVTKRFPVPVFRINVALRTVLTGEAVPAIEKQEALTGGETFMEPVSESFHEEPKISEEVQKKLAQLGFSADEMQGLIDAGATEEEILASKATTKESMLMEFE